MRCVIKLTQYYTQTCKANNAISYFRNNWHFKAMRVPQSWTQLLGKHVRLIEFDVWTYRSQLPSDVAEHNFIFIYLL